MSRAIEVLVVTETQSGRILGTDVSTEMDVIRALSEIGYKVGGQISVYAWMGTGGMVEIEIEGGMPSRDIAEALGVTQAG